MKGFALLLLLLVSRMAWAEDLGVIGPTYPIAEPHLLDDIARRLQAKKDSGEWARLVARQRSQAETAIRQPTPIGLVATRTPRTFYFDPTFVLDRNLLNAQGRLLFAAGARKNPLDVVSLPSPLLFIDGRDPRQRDQAQHLISNRDGHVTPVLVGGSYLELMQAWQRPVYFDQAGRLTRRLGITQVPALVSQEGPRLRIDELEIDR